MKLKFFILAIAIILNISLFAREEVITNTIVTEDTTITFLTPTEPTDNEEEDDDNTVEEEDNSDNDDSDSLDTTPTVTVTDTLSFSYTFDNSFTVNESDKDKTLKFHLSLSQALPKDLTVTYYIDKVTNGFELGKDIDISTRTNYLTIKAGDTSADIIVNVIDDKIYETDEKFKVTAKVPTKLVTYSDGRELFENNYYKANYATIIDNEISIAINDYVIFSEDNAKTSKMRFTVAASKILDKDLTLTYTLHTGENLILGKDIVANTTGTVTIKAGTKDAVIEIGVIDDDIVEDAEYFTINLKNQMKEILI